MPTYQYACTECGHAFEQFQNFSDDALTTCPECTGRLRKVYSAVGVVFKGSGFYRTDSRSTSDSSSSESAPSEGSSSSSEGSSSDSSSTADSSSGGSSSESSTAGGSSVGSDSGGSKAAAAPAKD